MVKRNMRHRIYAKYKNVMLRPVLLDDIESLRCWRNDPDNTKYLNHIGTITPEMQLLWFERDLNDPDSYTFAIVETECLDALVGSISLYNFVGKRCEQGRSMIGNRQARGVAIHSSKLAHHIAYSLLGIETIIAEAHKKNVSAVMLCRKLGFEISGEHCNNGMEIWEYSQNAEVFYKVSPDIRNVQIHSDWQGPDGGLQQ